ncbi:hypothetical protein HYV83_01615 [Candidatus Woesearchaeota archaeon]|nr:hypothetical protein [Candidatus Woesearchaeota archaeon]
MQLQIGKKKLEEIESLTESNCWKAFSWIHALILTQLKYLFYYKNQIKILGKTNITLTLNEQGSASTTFTLPDDTEHNSKWKKMDESIRFMSTAIDLCYSRSLIDEEYDELKRFNSFRNKKVGHIDIHEYLPDDEEVIKMCKVGLKIITSLDTKISNAIHNG